MSNERLISNYIQHVRFGAGAVEIVGEEAKKLGASRAMLVTDKGVVGAGLLDKVIPWLDKAGITSSVWDEVEANPSDRNVEAGTAFYKANRCDSIVSVGGGSSMDCAKGIQLMSSHPGRLEDYRTTNKGWEKIDPKKLPPHIAVATTSGTGSEVSSSMVITDTNRGFKIVVGSVDLYPTWAITDPEMAATMPAKITADTGIDAFSHALEAFLSPKNDPLGLMYARQSMKMIDESLREAVADGNDMEARTNMAYGSIVAIFGADQNSVGAPHPLGHQVTSQCHVPHGPACYLFWESWLNLGKPYATDKLAELAELMGVDVSGMSPDEAADAGIQAVLKLGEDVGMPRRLSEVGVKKDTIPQMAVFALDDFKSGKLDPYPSYSVEVMEKLYDEAF